MIKFKANDLRLHIEQGGVIPTGCVNTPEFTVELSPEWDGYSVTAQFIGAGKALHIAEIESGIAYTVPWECLTKAGGVSVSLMGVKGDAVKTSLPATISVKESLITDGSQPQTATPSAYEQYVNLVNDALDSADSSYEQKSNKLVSMLESDSIEQYPSVRAVREYLYDLMFTGIEDEMAEVDISGIAMPSAVAKYVLEKTYKPKWHKTTVTVNDDTTGVVILKDIRCYGAKAYIKTPKANITADMTLNFYKNGEDNPFFRLYSNGYISSTNDITYGLMEGELKDGIWDGAWYSATNSHSNIWVTSYRPRHMYFGVTEEDYPYADMVTVRTSETVTIPNGSVIDIWRLY